MSSLPCPPEQWPRFSSLLDAAMDLPDTDRARWLDSLGGEDAALKPWLVRVLTSATNTHTSQFLDHSNLPPPAETFAPGDAVGPYRLETPLGQGGMGEVWRASRIDDGPRREVALKLPHAELLGGPFRQRFARERDVLAALSHPHIAQLYDAGLSAEGHPYLALELVEGEPITEACRTTHATLQRRMELVRQVLDALSYAHQRLIVHRDIKPSNVLVTPEGSVKLLDFGIAKLLHPTEAQDAILTQAAGRLATPAYAAPEQFGDGTITVATDLFSVGVLLFELCTGRRPFDHPPLGPGAQAAPLASQRADAAAAGITGGKRLASLLRGDIDAVIARALALAPADRYSSAEAFARDLQCCGEGLPVSARRIGWPTRAGMFARRNKAGVGLVAVLALAVIGGTLGIAWQAQRAEREAVRATAIKDFLIDLFEKGDPRRGGKPVETMTAKELLDIGADRANTAFSHDPATEIELLSTLQGIYDAVDDGPRAETVAMQRLTLQRQLYGPADPRVFNGTVDLVLSQVMFLNSDKALALLDQIKASLFASTSAESLPRALWLYAHAASMRTVHGGRDQAIAECQASIKIFEEHFTNNSHYPEVFEVLAGYQQDAEQNEAALETLNRYRTAQIAQGQYDAMSQLQFQLQAATIIERIGRLGEADQKFADAQARAQRLVGPQSSWYIVSLTHRALLNHYRGDRAQAMAMFDQGLAIAAKPDAASGLLAQVQRAYAAALAEEGDATTAIPLLETALQRTMAHPHEEYTVRRAQGYLGNAYDQAGQTEKARALLLTARNDWVRYGAPTGPLTLGARERWARFLLDHGDPAGAAAEYRGLLDVAANAPSAPAALAAAGLARVALARGDLPQADAQSDRAVRILSATTVEYDVRGRIIVWLARAESLLASGKITDARGWAQKAATAAEQYSAPGSPQLAMAQEMVRRTSQ
jgi:hypothetical protein